MVPRRFLLTLAAFFVSAIALGPQRASAWGTAGHRLICEQAWDELTPETENRVGEILGVASRAAFTERCRHGDIAPADVMSLPAEAREISLDRDCPSFDSCPVREIERAVADLRSGRGNVADAVLRLAHFTGEVHQPLSVGYAADRNGLDIPATFLGRQTSMYAIWNEGLVTAPRATRAADTAFDLRVITNHLDRSRWILSSPLAWATESYWIMRTPATGYLGNPGNLAFDEVFVAHNKLTAMDQIEKAGIRLAHLLNRVFGDPNESPPQLSPPPS